MKVAGIDLGGTKVSIAVFSKTGEVEAKHTELLHNRAGSEVAKLIISGLKELLQKSKLQISSIGVSVPGISRSETGTVWAPNISGWEDYPLKAELEAAFMGIPVSVDSDRACYILGEFWKGAAQNCKDAIFLAVGTGIGAGILSNGMIIRGADDIAGAIGWMALDRPFQNKYISCGCFEYQASGDGLARICVELLNSHSAYEGELKTIKTTEIRAEHVFKAFQAGDKLAIEVIQQGIKLWGMAAANLVSLFNPRKIIFGGGVFGPAAAFIPEIYNEAKNWAQPISIGKVSFESSSLGTDAGVVGAGYLALKDLSLI